MSVPSLTELVPVLQTAIGPVILISGVGLLLLSMTNRLGRVIDRARILHGVLRGDDPVMRERAMAQLPILWNRADRIRKAIILSSVSALLAACLIITLFVAALFGLDAGGFIALLFVGCLVALVGSLVLFLKDVNQALLALKLELGDASGQAPHG